MNNHIKKAFTALALVGSSVAAHAEATPFDITTAGTEIATALGTAKGQIAIVLGCAMAITIGVVIYRKFSGGVSKA